MRNIVKRTGMFVFITLLVIACGVFCQSKPAYAKVKLNKKTVYMAKGDKVQLKVTGTKKKVKWSSSKKSICTVSKKGKITAKKIGKATITAKVGKKRYKCKVVVEKKSVNRARKLRDYVLSKKKYDKTAKGYKLSWEYDDGSCNITNVDITAYKTKDKKNLLVFHYRYHPESSYVNEVTMKIDLISGSASVRTGDLEVYRDDDIDDGCDESTVTGTITTAFDGKEDGLTLSGAKWSEQDEESNEVWKESEEAEVLDTYKESTVYRINQAFSFWNRMFTKKYKSLKKAGVNMKSIGFGKWSDK